MKLYKFTPATADLCGQNPTPPTSHYAKEKKSGRLHWNGALPGDKIGPAPKVSDAYFFLIQKKKRYLSVVLLLLIYTYTKKLLIHSKSAPVMIKNASKKAN